MHLLRLLRPCSSFSLVERRYWHQQLCGNQLYVITLSPSLRTDPPIFVRMIDISCSILFGWTAHNIPFQQRIVSYAHLYSYTSVKTLVHWFQIIRAQTFQMFDDEASGSTFGNPSAFYRVAKFPTKNIRSPIILIYGTVDSLVEYVCVDSVLTLVLM